MVVMGGEFEDFLKGVVLFLIESKSLWFTLFLVTKA